MSNLGNLLGELKGKKVTRGQFLAIVAGSIFGVGGLFRILQHLSTPDLATSDKGVFGEREYGHVDGDGPRKANEYTYNSEDVFG